MIVRLPFVGPYDWTLALRMIGAHAVPGGERLAADAQSWTRVLTGARGPVVVAVRPLDDQILVALDDAGDDLLPRLRHWLDLDLEPAPLLARFGDDPTLGSLVAERPGLRRIRYPEAFEAVVSTVLGQQVSLAAARTFAGRLVAAYGSPVEQGLQAFPRPDQVASVPVAELQQTIGITGARAQTVLAVAAMFADTGDWPVPLPAEEWDARADQLLALPGVGPWTVAYLRMRLFGDPDAVPVGDLVLRRALGVAKDREVLDAMEPWRPDRTYATFHLWASTAW